MYLKSWTSFEPADYAFHDFLLLRLLLWARETSSCSGQRKQIHGWSPGLAAPEIKRVLETVRHPALLQWHAPSALVPSSLVPGLHYMRSHAVAFHAALGNSSGLSVAVLSSLRLFDEGEVERFL